MGIVVLYEQVYCVEVAKWYQLERRMSVSELSIVSVALIITYVILVYNIKRYFKDHMILEIKSLSILFASSASIGMGKSD